MRGAGGVHEDQAIAVPGLEGGSKLPHSKARFARIAEIRQW